MYVSKGGRWDEGVKGKLRFLECLCTSSKRNIVGTSDHEKEECDAKNPVYSLEFYLSARGARPKQICISKETRTR